MSARDELADEIAGHPIGSGYYSLTVGTAEAREIAADILRAGYRKPRTITTVEELDALPAKFAILDDEGTPWVGDGDKVEPWASVCEDPYGGPIWKNSVDIALPVTVLHDPAVTS